MDCQIDIRLWITVVTAWLENPNLRQCCPNCGTELQFTAVRIDGEVAVAELWLQCPACGVLNSALLTHAPIDWGEEDVWTSSQDPMMTELLREETRLTLELRGKIQKYVKRMQGR